MTQSLSHSVSSSLQVPPSIISDKVFASAILHDVAKLMPKEEMLDILKDEYSDLYEELKDYPNVWHSFVGAYVAKTKYNIQDNEVLDAIKYHSSLNH